MAKHCKSNRHSKRHKRPKRGGGNYDSASTYAYYVNGSPNAQYARTLDQGGEYANRTGNVLIGAQGQWAYEPNAPSQQNLNLVQSAGKSRRKKGGVFGSVLNQAAVPLALLGLQQTYGRKRKGGKTRKVRRRRY